jgi:hypothetical protein
VDLLSIDGLRKALLGTTGKQRPTGDELKRDALLVNKFTQSAEYQVWAEEAWATISVNLQKSFDAKTDKETNLALGAVKGAMELLKISHDARREFERLQNEKDVKLATARR